MHGRFGILSGPAHIVALEIRDQSHTIVSGPFAIADSDECWGPDAHYEIVYIISRPQEDRPSAIGDAMRLMFKKTDNPPDVDCRYAISRSSDG